MRELLAPRPLPGARDPRQATTRSPPAPSGARLAELANGGELALLEGSGHLPHARDPVKVNLLLRDFVAPRARRRARWVRGKSRRKRALYISSPIGLGHAQRDAAIADELRKLHPDLEIDWLAQHPVTAVLEARGERIHPASAFLANESRHIESESAEHDLHCFQAIRRMDEILLSNFMVFHDLVRDEQYDLWIGDEAWELDYYLHENPEQKRTPYVWLTDFVGWLPMPDGGDHEAFLTGDYNEEMIEHIARFPRLRDQAVFVGNPEDIVPERFASAPALRSASGPRSTTRFAGYVTGFDPAEFADRAALRAELGYREDEQVCIVTVGGSGVGGDLLRRVIAAFPEAKERVPALRMIVVAGPRIDPATLPAHDGLEVRAYVHQLYRHLAACDLAVVQGGLTTSMELTANRRPFLYFPLRHHFEQNFHVRHRLERYGAGRCMDFERETPETIAAAIAETIGREVDYRPVESDGAARAAALIAPLLEEGKGRGPRRRARAARQPLSERSSHARATRQARVLPRLAAGGDAGAAGGVPLPRLPARGHGCRGARLPRRRRRRGGPRSSTRLPMPNVGDELHHFGWNRCSSACHGPDRSHLIVPGLPLLAHPHRQRRRRPARGRGSRR